MRITVLRHFRKRLGLAAMLGVANAGCQPFPTQETRLTTFTSVPARAAVFVDGVELGNTPISHPLSVAAQHHVVMTLPGLPMQVLTVPAGRENVFHVQLSGPSTRIYPFEDTVVIGRPLILADGSSATPSLDAPANAWLCAAAEEHASVAAFARVALELMNVGAPMELVAAHHRAALDEVEHARLSLALASERAGRPLTLGAMIVEGPREPTLVRVALDTFAEGCVGETASALVALSRLRDCDDDERPVYKRIARDETRHAELAWQTVGWALARGGDEVRAALQAHIEETRGDDDVWTHVILPAAAVLLSA